MPEETTWPGQWVADRLDVRLHGAGIPALLGLALRRNPRRAHLLVSRVLGKHVPQRPAAVLDAGTRLGARVRALLGDAEAGRATVLGYAETATGLGHCVADGIGSVPYLHSTRRRVPGAVTAGGFREEHSHATDHLLLPEDPGLLTRGGPLVLVDDEFSTGRTVRNTIEALHAHHPRDRYVIVALVDMRSAADRAHLDAFAARLGARVDVVALATGTVELPEDVLARGRALVEAHDGLPDTDWAGGPGSGVSDPRASDCAASGRAGSAGAVFDRSAFDRSASDRAASDRAAFDRVALDWPDGVPDGGRHGFTPEHRARLDAALPGMAKQLAEALGPAVAGPATRVPATPGSAVPGSAAPGSASGSAPGSAAPTAADGRRVLVLGSEELMYVPLRLAAALEEAWPGGEVRFSTTTRSPVLAVDDPGYAIRTRISFPSHDDPADGPGPRYAYNVAAGTDPARRFGTVVLVVDSAADTPALHAPGGLLDALRGTTDRVLLAVVPSYVPTPAGATAAGATAPTRPSATPAGPIAPQASVASGRPTVPGPPAALLPRPLRGPEFGSYAPDEVAWLLQDLSGVRLEAPTEEREEAIQSGGAHYAESLPVEYQPSAEYQALFRAALGTSAERIARAVGVVTDTVLAERGPGAVLASLARAGTPIGVLMRRWARQVHGVDLPHYAVSIVRGRGIDAVALRWLAAHHDPAGVVFVDGWTGKGAITRELAAALAAAGAGFVPEIAVLADPGGCVRTYGTRDDFLIPSACLNSTVSGLVSRTVLRADLVGPHDFHGAKFYRELAGSDVSGLFLDAVTARFAAVRDDVARDRAALATADREPTWAGWAAVERISEEYGIGDVNLVKPGVGETTRVLLRRVPWRILCRRGAGADLDHVRLLAEQRGVPVEETGDLPYSCVGLIHPHYTRGAVGASGTAAGGNPS
jgi:Phosphoribosyl transferase (PRTase)/Phosphoribosyl transferase/TRSP domain C terminus to PRTase_2/PELOTA RNA binding domain